MIVNIDKKNKKHIITTQEKLTGIIPIKQKENKMMLKAFSIRDSKSEVFNTPFFNKTMGEAERNFRTLVNDEKSTVHKFPEDFDLYWIGDYDDNSGTMKTLDTPQHIIKAVQVLNTQQ